MVFMDTEEMSVLCCNSHTPTLVQTMALGTGMTADFPPQICNMRKGEYYLTVLMMLLPGLVE